MNCCDSFGNCNQGRDCPVRQDCELPIDQDKPMRWIGRALDALMVVFLTGFVCWLLGVAGPELDAQVDIQTDAQKQAQDDFHKEVAAAEICRETPGESLISWNAAGELVCIPRGYIHRKNQIATR